MAKIEIFSHDSHINQSVEDTLNKSYNNNLEVVFMYGIHLRMEHVHALTKLIDSNPVHEFAFPKCGIYQDAIEPFFAIFEKPKSHIQQLTLPESIDTAKYANALLKLVKNCPNLKHLIIDKLDTYSLNVLYDTLSAHPTLESIEFSKNELCESAKELFDTLNTRYLKPNAQINPIHKLLLTLNDTVYNIENAPKKDDFYEQQVACAKHLVRSIQQLIKQAKANNTPAKKLNPVINQFNYYTGKYYYFSGKPDVAEAFFDSVIEHAKGDPQQFLRGKAYYFKAHIQILDGNPDTKLPRLFDASEGLNSASDNLSLSNSTREEIEETASLALNINTELFNFLSKSSEQCQNIIDSSIKHVEKVEPPKLPPVQPQAPATRGSHRI